MSERPEVPACAAIKWTTSGRGCVLAVGKRHHDCLSQIATMVHEGMRRCQRSEVQGFMTTRGRFVDRKEAMRLMQRAGIPSANEGGQDLKVSPAGFRGDELYSEDLY